MTTRILLLVLSLCSFSLFAKTSISPADLVKVTPKNNPKCVEYYSYKDEMYCNTTALESTPVDPHIKDYETQHIVFDNRPWQAVWGQQTDTVTTVEYVPKGDNIDAWNELVTSQFMPGLDKKTTPKKFADSVINGFRASGIQTDINFIEVTPDQVIFEFKIASPENFKQNELQKITRTDDGFYVLHYVIKQSDMSKHNREKWLKNLRASHIE